MKHLVIFCALMICLSACGNNTPKGITAKFLDCLKAKDYTKAVTYCTPRGAAFVNMGMAMGNNVQPLNSYTILKDSIVGDRAWVTCIMDNGSEKSNAKLELFKIDGKWKIDPGTRK